MSKKDRKAAIEYIPLYVISQPDKQYRKNFQTFLNQRGWEDELIGATPPPASVNENPSEISQLIAKTKAEQNVTNADKDNVFKTRIMGMIELLQKNPHSRLQGSGLLRDRTFRHPSLRTPARKRHT